MKHTILRNNEEGGHTTSIYLLDSLLEVLDAAHRLEDEAALHRHQFDQIGRALSAQSLHGFDDFQRIAYGHADGRVHGGQGCRRLHSDVPSRRYLDDVQ